MAKNNEYFNFKKIYTEYRMYIKTDNDLQNNVNQGNDNAYLENFFLKNRNEINDKISK